MLPAFLIYFTLSFCRVSPDPAVVLDRSGELPADIGGPRSGRPHQAPGRDAPRTRHPALLPLSAPSDHLGRRLLLTHKALHGEPGHHPHVRCGGHSVELLFHR